jgi:hypothetical protein
MTAPSYFGEIGVLEQIPRTATPASSSLMENARARLSRTHPTRSLGYAGHVP